MKLTTALAAGLLGATTVAAASMEEMMELKTKSWERAAARGVFGMSWELSLIDRLER